MKTFVLGLVILSCALVATGYGVAFLPGGAPPWAPWCLAFGSNGAIMSLMALGAMRRGELPPALRWTFIAMFAICTGAFGAALALPANDGPTGPLLFGLPLRAAIVIYGVGAAPIAILPFAYAFTFDAWTLSEAELRRVRDAAAAHREGGPRP
jgi:hypothetical protein